MDNKNILGRLAKSTGPVSPKDAVSRALFFAGTGQVLPTTSTTPTNDLDTQLKMQRLQTGDPDFIREQNALKLKTEFDNKLAFDEAQVDAKKKRLQEAIGGQGATGASFGMTPSGADSQANMPSSLVQGSPISSMSGGKVPQFLQVQSQKLDPETGMMLPEFDTKNNGEYLNPKQRLKMEQDKLKMELGDKKRKDAEVYAKKGAEDMLENIRQAKAGAKYFGPAGDLPSIASPSSYNPMKNITKPTPLGFDQQSYGDRAKWESNVNQLLSKKTLELISQLKMVSSTGATGMGNLSNKDLATLREASTNLNKRLDPEYAMQLLNDMERIQMTYLGLPTEQQAEQSSGLPDDQAYQEYLKMVGGR